MMSALFIRKRNVCGVSILTTLVSDRQAHPVILGCMLVEILEAVVGSVECSPGLPGRAEMGENANSSLGVRLSIEKVEERSDGDLVAFRAEATGNSDHALVALRLSILEAHSDSAVVNLRNCDGPHGALKLKAAARGVAEPSRPMAPRRTTKAPRTDKALLQVLLSAGISFGNGWESRDKARRKLPRAASYLGILSDVGGPLLQKLLGIFEIGKLDVTKIEEGRTGVVEAGPRLGKDLLGWLPANLTVLDRGFVVSRARARRDRRARWHPPRFIFRVNNFQLHLPEFETIDIFLSPDVGDEVPVQDVIGMGHLRWHQGAHLT